MKFSLKQKSTHFKYRKKKLGKIFITYIIYPMRLRQYAISSFAYFFRGVKVRYSTPPGGGGEFQVFGEDYQVGKGSGRNWEGDAKILFSFPLVVNSEEGVGSNGELNVYSTRRHFYRLP